MKKKASLPALVQLAIVTLVTTVLWIGFEVYRAIEKVPELEVSNQILQQLDPTLDQVALDRLVNRITLDDVEIGDTVLINPDEQTATPSPTAEPTTEQEVQSGSEIIIPVESTEETQASESGQS